MADTSKLCFIGAETGMRAIVLAVVAIQIGLGGLARAQTAPDSDRSIREMLPLFAKNHCEDIKNPADQMFCGDPGAQQRRPPS